jgi:hypothetical protein
MLFNELPHIDNRKQSRGRDAFAERKRAAVTDPVRRRWRMNRPNRVESKRKDGGSEHVWRKVVSVEWNFKDDFNTKSDFVS